MTTVNESLGAQSQMAAVLDQGAEILAAEQTVQFQKYTKVVVADGFVFWVATPQMLEVKGSLHYATDRMQSEDETIAVNQVLLTSEQLITEFNAISPSTMWIGAWPLGPIGGPTIQIAFSQRASFYKQADLFHYSGNAVYPALQSQLIQNQAQIPTGPIVSNSLPIWLSLPAYMAQPIPVYSSFVVPDNIVPPYVTAHVEPAGTAATGGFPVLGWPGIQLPNSGASPMYQVASSQLARDEVTFTMYGFTAQMGEQFKQVLIQLSMVGPGEPATFGWANVPIVVDAKRTQVEIAALAMKKTMHVSANYYQSTANAFAYRLILEALVTVTPGMLP